VTDLDWEIDAESGEGSFATLRMTAYRIFGEWMDCWCSREKDGGIKPALHGADLDWETRAKSEERILRAEALSYMVGMTGF